LELSKIYRKNPNSIRHVNSMVISTALALVFSNDALP